MGGSIRKHTGFGAHVTLCHQRRTSARLIVLGSTTDDTNRHWAVADSGVSVTLVQPRREVTGCQFGAGAFEERLHLLRG